MAAIQMDARVMRQEVHNYFAHGGAKFEALAQLAFAGPSSDEHGLCRSTLSTRRGRRVDVGMCLRHGSLRRERRPASARSRTLLAVESF